MKGSEAFMKTIEQFVISCADSDALFAAKACNPNMNIKDCVTFILNEVQKSGINGFTDEEVYSMAKHYFLEDSIDIGKPIECQVVVNHTVQLTPEEIEEQKRKARDKVFYEETARLRSVRRQQKVKQKEETETLLLFDM